MPPRAENGANRSRRRKEGDPPRDSSLEEPKEEDFEDASIQWRALLDFRTTTPANVASSLSSRPILDFAYASACACACVIVRTIEV